MPGPLKQLVAFSGGKDSTATALLMHRNGEDFDMFFTPTGNELPQLVEHMAKVVKIVGKRLIIAPNRSLENWIAHFNALPNNRQRWCTRLIKIEPCIAYLKKNPGTVLCVGLRADEESRQGLYGEHATYRYSLREANMNLENVMDLCMMYNVMPTFRTDCAVCPYQRLIEWYMLWRDQRDMWLQGEGWEAQTGYTFRSPSRDTWPAAMKDMRARFETGEIPARSKPRESACRVCSL